MDGARPEGGRVRCGRVSERADACLFLVVSAGVPIERIPYLFGGAVIDLHDHVAGFLCDAGDVVKHDRSVSGLKRAHVFVSHTKGKQPHACVLRCTRSRNRHRFPAERTSNRPNVENSEFILLSFCCSMLTFDMVLLWWCGTWNGDGGDDYVSGSTVVTWSVFVESFHYSLHNNTTLFFHE